MDQIPLNSPVFLVALKTLILLFCRVSLFGKMRILCKLCGLIFLKHYIKFLKN